MIDLHQGLTGDELREPEAPDMGTLLIAELDAMTSLLKGNFREAASKQRNMLRMAYDAAKQALQRRK